MRTKMKFCFLLFILLTSFSLVWAQRTTQTGVIDGRVVDENGEPLPGVNVTATSPALMLPHVTTVTNERGYFRFLQLPVGVYKVVFELPGFQKVEQLGVKVNFGGTTTLTITMKQAALEEAITIVGQAPTVDKQKTSLGVNLGLEFLRNIPAARDMAAVFNMAPGVISDTAHGSSVRDNAYNMDGVNITDPVTGTPFVGLGFEIAEEYTVQTSGHTAEYGSVRGAVLNVITKSGGNDISGEVNFYYRNKDLQADNTKGTPFEGQFVGFNYEYDTTFQLGAPIIKDKIWFFGNFTYRYQETYVEGYPYDKPQPTPYDRKWMYPFAKISWQINPAMRFVLSWNWSPFKRNHRGASRFRNEDTTWKQYSRAHTFNATYSYMISNNMVATAKGAAVLFDFDLMKKNDQPRFYDYTTRLYSGSYGYDDLYKRYRYQFLSDLTYYLDDWYGRHEFKTGIEFEYSWDTRERIHNRLPNGAGPFVYTRNGKPYRVYDYEDFKRHDQKYVYGAFIQDRWNPSDRLTINVGLRFDRQEGVIPKQGEDRQPVTYGGVTYDPRVLKAFKPVIWNTLSPRLGFSFDLTGDGKTVLKASYGRFFIANILQWFVTVNPNSYINRYYYLNPDWSLGRLYRISGTSGTAMDPDLRSPYLDEVVIGIQREIITDVSLSVSYIRKWDKYLLEDVCNEALGLEKIKEGEYSWNYYYPVTAVDPFNGQTVTFYNRDPNFVSETYTVSNPEPARRNYTGFEVVLNKRFSHNWQLLASYVYAKSTGLIGTDFDDSWSGTSYFDNPNAHINAEGRFPYERRHQFKLQGTVRLPFGILFSSYFRAMSGRRYTRLIRSSDLGLDLNQGNVTINAEPRGSRGLPAQYILDLRVEKEFRVKDLFRIGLLADMFNVFNANTATSVETLSSSPSYTFEEVTGILDPRIVRLGIRVMW